jgi:hypothetical protein
MTFAEALDTAADNKGFGTWQHMIETADSLDISDAAKEAFEIVERSKQSKLTFAEAKDQVAINMTKPENGWRYRNFEDLIEWVVEGWDSPQKVIDCVEKAASLVIAHEEWYSTDGDNVPDPGINVLLYSESAMYYVVGYWDQEEQEYRNGSGGPHLYCQPSHWKKLNAPER